MKKKMFLVLALSFACFAGYSQAIYTFPIDKYDFGIIKEGDTARYVFEFTNTGTEPLNLKRENVRPSCGCTLPSLTEGIIAPGKKGKITAEFPTANRPGTFNKTIHIFDSTAMVTTLTIKGIVIKKQEKTSLTEAQLKKSPKIQIDKKEYSFGKIEKGQLVAQKFIIKNIGKDTLKITSTQNACLCINHKLLTKDNTPEKYILPGKTAILEVTYTPPGLNKNRDVLALFTNDPLNPVIAITLTADVVESIIEKSPVINSGDKGSPFQK